MGRCSSVWAWLLHAPTQPHPGWDVLLGEVLLARAPHCIAAVKRLLNCISTWLSALVVWGIHTCWFESGLPHHSIRFIRYFWFLIPSPSRQALVVAGTSSVCSLSTPLPTSHSPLTCYGIRLGGKANPVFPILYIFLSFLFQHFSI